MHKAVHIFSAQPTTAHGLLGKLFTILGKTVFPFGFTVIRNSVLPHSQ